MPNLLAVMLGGAIGAGLRYHLTRFAAAQLGSDLPWGTLFINLIGGLLMGVMAGVVIGAGRIDQPFALFLGTGILGGFTTFSAFSLETALMIQRGELALAAAYSLVSVVGSVALLFVGLWFARAAA